NLALLGYARGKDRVGRLRPTLTVVVPPPATTTTTVPRPSHESDHHGDRPGVRADDRAERRRDLDLRLGPRPPHELAERGLALWRLGVRDPDAERGPVGQALLERADELLERLLVAAHPLDRNDLVVLDREDRLHVQELPRPGARPADPAAAREELERLDREDDPRLAPVACDELVDLLVGRASLEPPLDREREHREAGGDGAARDRAYLPPAQILAGAARALDGARE